MKLPEPDTYCWSEDTHEDVWSYSKELVTAMIAERDAVLKIALDALDHACGGRCNAEYNPCHARLAADTIRKVLA